MSRPPRPFLPGVVFHITTRIQGGEPLLEPIRDSVTTLLRHHARLAQIQIVGYAIMPNHLHVLAQQGSRPLAAFMQPLLTTIAGMVRRGTGGSGHIFKGRYFANPCLNANYLRHVLAYMHLNPVRAGLCARAIDYRWSSERRFLGIERCAGEPREALASELIRIFGRHDGEDSAALRRAYEDFCAWRLACDRAARDDAPPPPEPPPPIAGDVFWDTTLAPAASLASERLRDRSRVSRPSLRDLARRAAGDLRPELLRERFTTKAIRRARRRFILLAAQYGFAQVRIAAFLNVSPSTVSNVVRADHIARQP